MNTCEVEIYCSFGEGYLTHSQNRNLLQERDGILNDINHLNQKHNIY